MGFFDSIKKAKNYLTGGGVKIDVIQIDQPQLRAPFKIEVVVIVEDGEIEADKIYLHIKNVEHVKKSVEVTDEKGNAHQHQEIKQNILFEQEYVLDQLRHLRPHEIYKYQVEVSIPVECFPAFTGIDARYTWTMQAAIDKAGNNPESDLIDFEPAYTIS